MLCSEPTDIWGQDIDRKKKEYKRSKADAENEETFVPALLPRNGALQVVNACFVKIVFRALAHASRVLRSLRADVERVLAKVRSQAFKRALEPPCPNVKFYE